MTDLEIALDKMYQKGYSLVKVGNRWQFTISRNPEENPPLKFPLVTSGDVLRMGHWNSPAEALQGLFLQREY